MNKEKYGCETDLMQVIFVSTKQRRGAQESALSTTVPISSRESSRLSFKPR